MAESIAKMLLGRHRTSDAGSSAPFDSDFFGFVGLYFSRLWFLTPQCGAVGWFLETFSLVLLKCPGMQAIGAGGS